MKEMSLFVAIISVFILVSLGCISDSPNPDSSTFDKHNLIDYSIELVESHDRGISIDANILVQ